MPMAASYTANSFQPSGVLCKDPHQKSESRHGYRTTATKRKRSEKIDGRGMEPYSSSSVIMRVFFYSR